MPQNLGLAAPADLLTLVDGYAGLLASLRSSHGIGDATESTTLAAKAQAFGTRFVGDGTTTYPGIANQRLKTKMRSWVADLATYMRYDILFSTPLQSALNDLDTEIQSTLPAGWVYTSFGANRLLDLYVTRCNGTHPSIPVAPTIGNFVITATTGGALAANTGGTAPVFKFAWVGAFDNLESLPSAASTPVALSGSMNAYHVVCSEAAPATCTKLRIYATVTGAQAGPWVWSYLDVTVTPASVPAPFDIVLPELSYRSDVGPVSYLSCPFMPENAAIFAMSSMSARFGTALTTIPASVPKLPATGLIMPYSAFLNPVDGFLGIYNPASTGEFGRWTNAAYVAGTIRSTNDAASFLQGFLGAIGVEARIETTLNAGTSLTVNYTYRDAIHPTDTAATSGSQTFSALTPGTRLDLGIATSRVVTSITAVNITGATTGAIVFEGKAVRTLP